MSRNFPDFIEAYFEYAKDNWCPETFHFWSAISTVCAALERKVWMLQSIDPAVIHYPNLYIMLVAAPGDGKSTAGRRAVRMLKEIVSAEGKINFVPSKITDAALVVALKTKKRFFVGAQEHWHASAFYYAGEASNSLRAIKGGDEIFPTMTEAYDCDDTMEKATIARQTETIEFPCMNILACSTPDNLKGMLTDGGILGGFVSRFLFVVSKEQMIRHPEIMDEDEGEKVQDPRFFLLCQDLQQIFQMTGRFVPDPAYRKHFREFFPANDAERHKKNTEKEQAILARKGSAIIKLSMVMAASEGNDMVLKGHHWAKANQLVESLETKYDTIVELTHAPNTQDGIDAMILTHLQRSKGGISEADLIRSIAKSGANREFVAKTVASMLQHGQLRRFPKGGKPHLGLGTQCEPDLA